MQHQCEIFADMQWLLEFLSVTAQSTTSMKEQGERFVSRSACCLNSMSVRQSSTIKPQPSASQPERTILQKSTDLHHPHTKQVLKHSPQASLNCNTQRIPQWPTQGCGGSHISTHHLPSTAARRYVSINRHVSCVWIKSWKVNLVLGVCYHIR